MSSEDGALTREVLDRALAMLAERSRAARPGSLIVTNPVTADMLRNSKEGRKALATIGIDILPQSMVAPGIVYVIGPDSADEIKRWGEESDAR